ncbi:hypothetical protein [Clostridium perfringens]|uniref:hypothetical protein n=1 Tax=Clostridium perfringens TaxID=1502 RepID=UPI0024BC0768|nr:hypothetical protein [Clostridium perfringens]CAJ1760396.1 hypothetical protein AUSP0115_00032 [uncultured phage]
MNKRQIKKLMKSNQIKFNKIKLNKDDVLVIDFGKDYFSDSCMQKICSWIHDSIFPKNKILPLHGGMSIGVIERGESDGSKK